MLEFIQKIILLANLCLKGLEIKVIPSSFAEDLDKSKFNAPVDYVIENSRLKVLDVAKNLKVSSNCLFLFIKNSSKIIIFEA